MSRVAKNTPKAKTTLSRRTANLVSHVCPRSEAAPDPLTARKRSRRKKKESLYHLYNDENDDNDEYEAHNGYGGAGGGGVVDAFGEQGDCLDEEFTVGMDVDLLIGQTRQSLVRSVCLEDVDHATAFGDAELLRFVSVLKLNTSILSLQIRYLNVSDLSLVPLCHALQSHPTLRALDLSGTRGGRATSLALRELVCKNPNIVFVRVDNMYLDIRDAIVIEEGTQYNAMVCADPTSNPFHLSLLRKLSSIEEQAQKFDEELNAKPWLSALMGDGKPAQGEASGALFKKVKKPVSHVSGAADISADVCVQYMKGRCAYGSRCHYFHPERTAASTATPGQAEAQASQDGLAQARSTLIHAPVRLNLTQLAAKRSPRVPAVGIRLTRGAPLSLRPIRHRLRHTRRGRRQ